MGNKIKKTLIASIQAVGFLLVVVVATAAWWPVSLFQLLPLLTLPLTVGTVLGLWFWRRRNRLYFRSHIVMLILLLWSLPAHIQWNGSDTVRKEDVQVLSFNVGMFRNQPVEAYVSEIKALDADVVCLQEFGFFETWPNVEQPLKTIASDLGYPHYTFHRWDHDIYGVATFSKWPIEQNKTVYVEELNTNAASWISVNSPAGPLGVLNTHLSSFNFKHELTNLNSLLDKVFKGINLVQGHVHDQWRQSDSIRYFLSTTELPTVVVGDFNSLAGSKVVNDMQKTHSDAFREAGHGLGTTFNRGGIPLRIDYQFAPPEWKVIRYETIDTPLSDHYPLLVTYRRRS